MDTTAVSPPGEQYPGGHGGGLTGEPLNQQLLHPREMGPVQLAEQRLQPITRLVGSQIKSVHALEVGRKGAQSQAQELTAVHIIECTVLS